MKSGSASLLLVLFGALAPRAGAQEGAVVSAAEYEGWRQYSVQCARCHGQDVLPNPVAANLLVSLAPGGPAADKAAFSKVVTEGRANRGMPPFKDTMTPEQVDAVYAYVKGRAEKRIPAGRPKEPAGQKKEAPG
jgi:mono/diheme cytochrome c family protein